MRLFPARFIRSLLLLALLAATHQLSAQEPQQTPSQPAPQPAAQPTAQPAAQDEKATVFIYRTKKFVGSALEPSVFCDGVELGRMDNGRYIVLKLDPGEHRIHTTEEFKRVDLKLGRGERAFVRFRLEAGAMKGRGNVYLTNDEDAIKELKKLQPLDPKKLKDRTLTVVEADKAAAELKRISSK